MLFPFLHFVERPDDREVAAYVKGRVFAAQTNSMNSLLSFLAKKIFNRNETVKGRMELELVLLILNCGIGQQRETERWKGEEFGRGEKMWGRLLNFSKPKSKNSKLGREVGFIKNSRD